MSVAGMRPAYRHPHCARPAEESAVLTDEELCRARDAVMKALTQLSAAARAAKETKLTRLSSDLYYASNRAWRELDAVARRQGQ